MGSRSGDDSKTVSFLARLIPGSVSHIHDDADKKDTGLVKYLNNGKLMTRIVP